LRGSDPDVAYRRNAGSYCHEARPGPETTRSRSPEGYVRFARIRTCQAYGGAGIGFPPRTTYLAMNSWTVTSISSSFWPVSSCHVSLIRCDMLLIAPSDRPRRMLQTMMVSRPGFPAT
jgi:hypothetical protein